MTQAFAITFVLHASTSFWQEMPGKTNREALASSPVMKTFDLLEKGNQSMKSSEAPAICLINGVIG